MSHPNVTRTWIELEAGVNNYDRVLVVETNLDTTAVENQSDLDDIVDWALRSGGTVKVRIVPSRS